MVGTSVCFIQSLSVTVANKDIYCGRFDLPCATAIHLLKEYVFCDILEPQRPGNMAYFEQCINSLLTNVFVVA